MNHPLLSNTKGIAVEKKDGEIMAVAVCDTWMYNSVQLHIAIDNPIVLKNGRFQKEIAEYLFNYAGRELILGFIPANNEKSIRFAKKSGFVEIYRIKQGYAEDEDMVILELRKEDCRFIEQPKKLKVVGGTHG